MHITCIVGEIMHSELHVYAYEIKKLKNLQINSKQQLDAE